MGIWDDFTKKVRGGEIAGKTAEDVALGTPLGLGVRAYRAIPDAAEPAPIAPDPSAPTAAEPRARYMGEVDAPKTLAPGQTKGLGYVELPDAPPPQAPVRVGGPGAGAVNGAQARVLADEDKLVADQRALTGAEIQRDDKIAGAIEGQAAEQQRQIADEQRIAADAAARQDKWMRDSVDLSERLSKQELDPNRLYGHADTGTKIGLILGGMLGGAAGALQGGKNAFVDQLNRNIDRDIDAQKENYARGKDLLAQRNTVFDQMMRNSGDYRLARAQTRLAYLEASKAQLQAMTMRAGNPVTQANGDMAATKLQVMADREKLEVQKEAQRAAAAAAAAQAKAQKEAEQEAYARAKDVDASRREWAKLDLEAQKASKEKGGDLETRVQGYGKTMLDKDVQSRANAIGRLSGQLGPGGIPGVGQGADLRERLTTTDPLKRAALGMIPGVGAAHQALSLSNQERINRTDWEQMKLAYIHEVTGAGGPPEEKAMIAKALEGSKTPAEQRAALEKTQAYLDRYRGAARGTYGADAEAEFRRRVGGGSAQ